MEMCEVEGSATETSSAQSSAWSKGGAPGSASDNALSPDSSPARDLRYSGSIRPFTGTGTKSLSAM